MDVPLGGMHGETGPAFHRAFGQGKHRSGKKLFIDPSDSSPNPLLHPPDFILVGIAHVIVRPRALAKDRPAPEDSSLGFIQKSRPSIDARQAAGSREGVRAKLPPAINIALAKVRILKEAPEPGVLMVIQLRPIP